MANVPRSSFIPKQVTSATPKKVRHTRVFSVLAFGSSALLIVSLLLSVGVFIYKNIEQSNLEKEQAALASARSQFDEQDMAEVRSFNKRIELARSLLEGHVMSSKIFKALESSTKQSVQYTSFTYVRRPSGDVSIDLFGVTDDFAKVALQSLENSEDFILKDAAVTEVGISLGAGSEESTPVTAGTKRVSFKIVANVPASKILFDASAIETQPVEGQQDALEGATSTDETDIPPVPETPATENEADAVGTTTPPASGDAANGT